MDNEKVYLLKLLSAAIRGQKPPDPDFDPVDWERIFSEAAAHEVHTLIYPAVKTLSLPVQPPPHVLDKWERICLLSATRQLQYMNEAYRVLQVLADSNISVIVLKGLLLRELYPQSELRTMGDIDLLVKPIDVELAGQLLKAEGYSRKEHNGLVDAFNSINFLNIELHYALFNPERFGNLHDFEKQLWEHANYCTVGGQSAFTLSLEDNLIYLLVHMAKHFQNAGFGLRQLCDVVLFIEAYGQELNWSYFGATIQPIGYEPFAMTVLETCRHFLGLNMPLPLTCNKQLIVDKDDVFIFIQDVISAGVYGRKTESRSFGNGMMNELQKSDNSKTLAKFAPYLSFISHVLFPAYSKLGERYSYACKYPLLLPIAWLHRAFFVTFVRNSPQEVMSIIKNAPVIASNRLDLLKKLNLMVGSDPNIK